MSSALIPSEHGVETSKILILLSLVLPYLLFFLDTSEYSTFGLYAPVWLVIRIPNGTIQGGPTPIALLMFFYWIPYVVVGVFSYNYANARYKSTVHFVARILVVTAVAVLLSFPLAQYPMASSGGHDYYPLMIPLPSTTLVTLLLIPALRPDRIESPWERLEDSAASPSN